MNGPESLAILLESQATATAVWNSGPPYTLRSRLPALHTGGIINARQHKLLEATLALWAATLEPYEGAALTSPAALVRACHDIWHLEHEELWLIGLNPAHHMVCKVRLAEGAFGQVPVVPQVIARHAIASGASHVVLFHNHPVGDCTPSPPDLIATHAVAEAMEALGIKLLDHLVVSGPNFMGIMSRSRGNAWT